MTTSNRKMQEREKSSQKRRSMSTKERYLRERMFGQIALKSRKISKEKLKKCLLYQKKLVKQGVKKKIGDILVQNNLLSEKQVEEVLKKQNALDLIRKREFGATSKKKSAGKKPLGSLVKKYKTGEVIFKENEETCYDLFVIQAGEIGVYKNSIHLGKRFERGAFLGTTSCLLKTPRVSTAVAMKDSTLLKIPESDVQAFFAKNPQMAVKLSSVLAQRVLQITNKYVEIVKELPDSKEKLRDSALIEGAEDDSSKEDLLFDQPLVGEDQLLGEKSKICEAQENMAEHANDIESESSSSEIPRDIAEKEHLEISVEIDGDEVTSSEKEEPEVGNAGLLEPENTTTIDNEDSDKGATTTQLSNSSSAEEEESELDENGEPIKIDPILAVMVEPDTSMQIPQGEIKEIISQEKPIEFSSDIRGVLKERLDMYIKLDQLAERINELEGRESTTDKARNELASLRRELIKIPPYEPLKMKRDKLEEMVASSDTDSGRPPLTDDVIEAFKISIEQKNLMIGWYDGMSDLIKTCAVAATGQIMYKVLKMVGVSPDEVFGWAVYVLAMKEYAEELKEEQKELKKNLKDIQAEEEAKKSSGIFKLFKKKPEADEEELEAKEKEKEELISAELICRSMINGINKELAQVEPVMVNAFWDVYGALGLKLVKGVDAKCERYVRVYLRWGVLGFAEDFMQPEILETLLAECDGGAVLQDFGMESNYIIYADEVIELTAKKVLLPSPNEELEMNERNSPNWKLDRAHRKVVGGEFYLSILKNLQEKLEKDAAEKCDARTEKENELADVAEDDPDRKAKTKALKKSVQALKVAAVKCEKLVEKVRDEMAEKIQNDIDAGKEAMEELDMQPDPEELARHEIRCIRRFSRLVAKLQEPFLPFTLMARFNPDTKTPNTREEMLKLQNDIEEKDPLIFKENMLATMKKNNRVQIRSAPFIHLLPASGIMGFLVAPRSDTYSGKLMLPSYYERTGMREAIAIETFSDFRYDTSKEQAGNDVMNSDTLVAAYAEVRWIMRKKEKEVRQKAGIFMDENERTNFRRHYAMYINSAYEGGKQLFFKCPDLYELTINKFIELPEGVDILARG